MHFFLFLATCNAQKKISKIILVILFNNNNPSTPFTTFISSKGIRSCFIHASSIFYATGSDAEAANVLEVSK
jgi:hypothetical protein